MPSSCLSALTIRPTTRLCPWPMSSRNDTSSSRYAALLVQYPPSYCVKLWSPTSRPSLMVMPSSARTPGGCGDGRRYSLPASPDLLNLVLGRSGGLVPGSLALTRPRSGSDTGPLLVENAFMTNDDLRPVYFLSDSTGITAETLGNTLLTQFPASNFDRITVPFITTVEQARTVVGTIDKLAATGPRPIVFSTAVSSEVRQALAKCDGIIVDLIGTHVGQLEQALGSPASGEPGRAHGLGNAKRYQSRMAAVEYAMEHDDGQSLRALEKAQVILVAPSRCGKTPTTMYLALQHGIFAANFPLVDEDFVREGLPKPLRPFVEKCFGLSSNPLRLSQIRTERRRGSPYASLRQCGFELRSAEQLYISHRIPYLNSATVSVEEMAATILQRMNLKH